MKTALWCIALSVVFAGVLALAVAKETTTAFTHEERTWLAVNRSRGHFVGEGTFVFCDKRDGGRWTYFYADGDYQYSSRVCWLWLIDE